MWYIRDINWTLIAVFPKLRGIKHLIPPSYRTQFGTNHSIWTRHHPHPLTYTPPYPPANNTGNSTLPPYSPYPHSPPSPHSPYSSPAQPTFSLPPPLYHFVTLPVMFIYSRRLCFTPYSQPPFLPPVSQCLPRLKPPETGNLLFGEDGNVLERYIRHIN